MKTIRNCKINRICYKLYSKYRKNVISLVTAAVLLFTSMPLSEASSVVAKMVSKLSNAITAMAEDTYTEITITNGVYTVNTASDLVNLFNADPSVYKDITIKFATTEPLTANAIQGITKGLGNESNPFSGKIEATDGSPVNIPLDVALFEYLDDSAELCDITLRRPTNGVDNALLAEHVTHSDTTTSAKGWNVKKETTTEESQAVNYSFTSVIGEMAENSIVGLTITCVEDTVVLNTSGNAGLACGKMGESAQLTVITTASDFRVTATSGNAGSLVGEMGSGTKLTIDKTYNFTGEVTGANAGGIVGSSTDGALEIGEGGSVKVTGTVTASVDNDAAGGMFGCYTYNIANDEAFMYKFDLTKWKDVKATVGSAGADGKVLTGGFFGTLVNNSSNKICINSDMSVQYEPVYSDVVRASSFGGLIGKYSASSLTASLEINAVNMNLQQISNVYDFGGLIGSVKENTQAYIKIDTAKITVASSSTTNNNGGLIGFIYHSFVDVCGSTTIVNKSASAKYVGGLVSRFVVNGSVLRLSGTTDLTNAYPASADKNKCQIVGERNDALIYAVGDGENVTDGKGWKLIRNNSSLEIDDMDWGEVLRLDGTELCENTNGTFGANDVLYFNESNHTVTIKGFDDKGNVEINNKADFARAALIMQQSVLNPFIQIGGTVKRSDMLSATINIQKDIDLSGTGITGFTRDTSGNVFSGTLNGNSYKITLAVGEPYGTFSGEEGKSKGQIVYHNYNGLFASTNGAEISDLTIDADFSNVVGKTEATKIGALSAFALNGLTVENVTATITASISTNQNPIIGGLVGFVQENNDVSNLSFTGCNVTSNLTYSGTNDNTYLGGVIGAVEYASAERKINFDDVTVEGSIKQESTSVTNARVGGLVAEIRANDVASGTYNEVTIKDVNINGLDIDTKATSTSGGFFGHNWYRTNVILYSATVSNSTLKTACTEFGGLVTATTGYWNISKLTFGEGIEISGSKANAFGMLADSTFGRPDDPYGSATKETCELDGSYIEFITPDGYKINSATTISLGNNARFDEIAAYGIHSGAFSKSDSNGQSIISLPADNNGVRTVIMDGENCNTYQNQTTNNGSAWAGNSLSRYYYNLDEYRESPNGNAQKLLIWSVHQFAADNIKKYFKQDKFPTGTDFDLNGYSYYPVDADSVDISSAAKFTFHNKEINDGEAASGNTDNYARETTGSDDSHTQHYMMHHGLFRNITNLTVSGKITLSGSIGKTDNGSGALVCGKVLNAGNTRGKLSVTGGISLDSLYVNSTITTASYAPLLINKIDSTTDISINNVSTTDKSKYSMNNQQYAATSLIGEVGSSTANDIVLSFSGIKLAAGDDRLFSRATLLESFQYSGTSSGIYNYTWEEDWGSGDHNVTYGKEVSLSKKNSDRQHKYYNDWDRADERFTSPNSDNAKETFDFSNYLPYVAKTAVTGTNDETYHEIDVNVKRPNLINGCGTYSDPYIVDGDQLELISKILNSDSNITSDWEINYNASVSPDNATVDASSAFCNAENVKHSKYIYNSTTKVFVNAEDQTQTLSVDNVVKYLCEAYYKINTDIELSEGFAGLGGTTNDRTFRGVIVGNKSADGTYPTITNNSNVSLIRFSNGSVIKDLSINNTQDLSLYKGGKGSDGKYSQINYTTSISEVYGGVIAVVFGGDNIIDNVSVTHPNNISLGGDGKHLIPAGGYIGAIVYGGVIFRNMKNVAENSALTIDEAKEDKYTNLFVNPYIGRVVNGFAIEEGDTFRGSQNLDNGNKNYVITEFKSKLEDGEKLNVEKGSPNTITVPNAQALFMLSIITQSGMGYTVGNKNTCGYGHYTFTRSAEYSNVGSSKLTEKDDDYINAILDYKRLEKDDNNTKAFEKKASVMLQKYTETYNNKYEAKWIYDKDFTIDFVENVTYNLSGTGFRGINRLFEDTDIGLDYSNTSRQTYNTSNTAFNNNYYQLSKDTITIKGNSSRLILDMNVNIYVSKAADYNDIRDIDNYKLNYFYTLNVNKNPAKGFGFINLTERTLEVNNLTISGNVHITSRNENGSNIDYEDLATGAIVGLTPKSCTFTNINIGDLDVHATYTTGGLIGKAGDSVTMNNINSVSDTGLSVYGSFETGGLIGNALKGFDLNKSEGSKSEIIVNQIRFPSSLTMDNKDWFGFGGIAGAAYGTTKIDNVSLVPKDNSSFIGTCNIDNTTNESTPVAIKTMNVGGLIGLASGTTTITDTNVSVSIYGNNAGGFIGQNSVATTTINTGVYGGSVGGSEPSIVGYSTAGGFVGYQNADVTISTSKVANSKIVIPISVNNGAGVGGIIGKKETGNLTITDCEVNNVELASEDSDKGAGVGGVLGQNNKGDIAAYDILLNNLTFTKNNNDAVLANLIGWNEVQNVVSNFVGVSVNNSTSVPDVHYDATKVPTNFTAIHTDYKCSCTADDKAIDFGTGDSETVDAKSPYVNVNPAKTYDNLTLTGDFVAGNMSDVIAAAKTGSDSDKKYQNTGVNVRADGIDQTKLKLFSEVADQKNDTVNSMPILLIDDNSSANITTMLSDYVSVLTNHDTDFGEDQSSFVNVSVQSYKYDNNNWTKTDKSSLTYDTSKHRFKTQNGVYDNDGTARFTLITLDYKDPTGSSKTALRIHIPVFVKKVLDFSFTSRVLTGTDYNHSDYNSTFAFESFGSPITTYFTYTYYRTEQEWADAINNGDDLLWNFDKKLKLWGDNKDSGVLPAGTKLTLVDVNQSDKAYQKTANEVGFSDGVLDLSKFSDDLITLNGLLMKYADVTAKTDESGLLVETTEDDATATAMATLNEKLVYFRPASDAELENASVAKYSVSVTNKDKTNVDTSDRIKLSENYYLTIQTPAVADTAAKSLIKNFVGYSSTTDNKLDCPNGKSLPTNELFLTTTNKTDTATYIIANFLTQDITVKTNNSDVIDTSNDKIDVTLQSVIKLEETLADTFREYVKNNDFAMYQGFNISLTKFENGNNGTATQIVGGSTVEGEFSIGETKSPIDSFTLTEAKDNLFLQYPKSIWDNLKENNNVTISADVKITYSTAGMIEQFPERKDGDKTTGIAVNASSNIAYSEDSVEHSQVSVTAITDQHYYRYAMSVANLSYDAVESAVIEAKDSPFSQLGVNPNDMSSEQMLITAKGHYDLTELTENIRNQGKQIKFTMTLSQKNAGDEYVQVDNIDKYLNGITLTSDGSNSVTTANGDDAYTFTISYDKSNTYDVTTKFNVITGKAFENNNQTYANYKVQLTAELLDKDSNPIAGTTVSDYIIYTNARINTSFISAS